MATIEGIIRERGHGLASVGDYVTDTSEVYRVVKLVGPIQTGRSPGAGNWQLARVEFADWGDVPEDAEPVCSVEIEEPSEEDLPYGDDPFCPWESEP